MKFSDLIFVRDDALDKKFCKQVIDKFELDNRKKPGKTVGNKLIGDDLEKTIKNSTDLYLSEFQEWKSEDTVFYESASLVLEEYDNHCRKIFSNLFFSSPHWNYCDTGYQLQKYDTTQEYKWHQDFHIDKRGGRMVTLIWYLNTVESGGNTEFMDGTKIKAKAGRCLAFPATWNYTHRGTKPKSGEKYIAVSFLYGVPNY